MTKTAEIRELTYISDPGHGWLEVPLGLAFEVRCLEDISEYSYMWLFGKGKEVVLFLEEDCDMPVFLAACERKGIKVKIIDRYEENTPIRHYCPYKLPQRSRDALAGLTALEGLRAVS